MLSENEIKEILREYPNVFGSTEDNFNEIEDCLERHPQIYSHLSERAREVEEFIVLGMRQRYCINYVPQSKMMIGIMEYISYHSSFPDNMDYKYFIDEIDYPLNYFDLYPKEILEDKELFLKIIGKNGDLPLYVKDIPNKFHDDGDVCEALISKRFEPPNPGPNLRKNREFIVKISKYDFSEEYLEYFDLSVLKDEDIEKIIINNKYTIGLFPNMKERIIKWVKIGKIDACKTKNYISDWDINKTSAEFEFGLVGDQELLQNKDFIKYCIPLKGYKWFNSHRGHDIMFYERFNDEILGDDEIMTTLLVNCPFTINLYLNFGKNKVRDFKDTSRKIVPKMCYWNYSEGVNRGIVCRENIEWNNKINRWNCKKHSDMLEHIFPTIFIKKSDDFWINILRQNRGMLHFYKFRNKEIEFAGYRRIRNIKKDVFFKF